LTRALENKKPMPKVSTASRTSTQHPAPIDAFCERIKALRDRAGLTGAELDRLAGFCTGTTGRLERGDQRIYASHLFYIAQATGIDIGWFYRADNPCPKPNFTPGPEFTMEFETQRLLEAYMRINDLTLKRDVFELVEVLAESTKN